MKLFGLTGGIGMGKSTAARLLSDQGLPVVDTDILAHELTSPGQSALGEIVETFGAQVVDEAGRLQRPVLARIVFGSLEKRKELEQILHPRIRERWMAQVNMWRQEGRAAGVVVIPLLFETAAQSEFEAVLCTACTGASQQQRLEARHWPREQIQQRIDAQWPVEKKMSASNHVIWTEGSLGVHARQLQVVMGRYLGSRR
jgi:dephospho-CoA kinase